MEKLKTKYTIKQSFQVPQNYVQIVSENQPKFRSFKYWSTDPENFTKKLKTFWKVKYVPD